MLTQEQVARILLHADSYAQQRYRDSNFGTRDGFTERKELVRYLEGLTQPAGVAPTEAPRYEQCGEAVFSQEYGVLQMSRHIGFLALAADDRMRDHRIEAVYRRVTDGVGGTVNAACGVHGPIPCEGARCICARGVEGGQK